MSTYGTRWIRVIDENGEPRPTIMPVEGTPADATWAAELMAAIGRTDAATGHKSTVHKGTRLALEALGLRRMREGDEGDRYQRIWEAIVKESAHD